jgi:hypothetical protein
MIIKISVSSKTEKSRCQVSGVNNWNNFWIRTEKVDSLIWGELTTSPEVVDAFPKKIEK